MQNCVCSIVVDRILILSQDSVTLLSRDHLAPILTASFLMIIAFLILYVVRSRRERIRLQIVIEARTRELAEEKKTIDAQNQRLHCSHEEVLAQNKEIIRQRDEIRAISERLHEADLKKIDFFTTISHEIRTPLTLILEPLEKLLSGNAVDVQTRIQLRRIFKNALTLRRLANQVLDFTKKTNSQDELELSQLDVVSLLKEIMSSFYDMAKEHQINVKLSCNAPAVIAWIDREKFSTVVYNLLTNAFQATPQRGHIGVSVVTSDQLLRVAVSDSGNGIPAQDLGHIFDSAKHYENHPLGPFEGSGLGLGIAKRCACLHGGNLFVESAEGGGARFILELPLAACDRPDVRDRCDEHVEIFAIAKDTEQSEVIRAKVAVGSERMHGKILVVEDNGELRGYLKELLQPEYNVIEALNGKDALRKAGAELPDVVISDVMMPAMNGVELCKELKDSLTTSHIPVILLTGKTMEDHKLEGLQCGADDYIVKPFHHHEILLKVRNLIKRHELLKRKVTNDAILQPQHVELTSADEKFLRKAMAVVEQNISNCDFDVAELIAELAVSRTLLHTKLKALTNFSATEFIKSVRMKRAAQLLSQKKISVAEVAYMVGFKEPQYFNKCFKKQFGVTPGLFAAEGAAKFSENKIL